MAENRKDPVAHYLIDNEDGMKNLITRVLNEVMQGVASGPDRSRQVRNVAVWNMCGYIIE
jgi:hypothetical protein